jgi:hypothetical protein
VPRRQIIIRPTTIDVVSEGLTVSQVPRPAGAVEASWLVGRLPSRWVSAVNSSTVRLSAEVVLRRGAVFEVGPLTSRLELVGGSDPREAAGISAGSGVLLLLNTKVVSVDPATAAPVGAQQPGRPWMSVGAGGRADVRDSTVSGLGRGVGSRAAGLFLGPGATGSIARSTFEDNNAGLVLSGTRSVSLTAVTIHRSVTTGLSLRDDIATTTAGVTSTDNGQDGVSVSGVDGRRISGLRTQRNHRYGVRLADLRDLIVTDANSVDDHIGLALDTCQNCEVKDLHAQGGAVGLQVAGASSQVRVNGGAISDAATGARLTEAVGMVHINGLSVTNAGVTGIALCGTDVTVSGATVSSRATGIDVCGRTSRADVNASSVQAEQIGIRAVAPASGVSVGHTTVTGGRGAGVDLSASGVSLSDVRVERALTGVHVYGQASGINLERVTVLGGRDGIVATGSTTRLTVADSTVSGISGVGLSSGSDGLSVRAGTIRHADTGLNLRGHSQITGLSVLDVVKGVKVSPDSKVDGQRMDVLATKVGIQVEHGGSFVLTDSRVRASRALVGRVDQKGHNVVTLPPFPWFGFAAIAALVLALLLELIHRFRTGRSRKTLAPDHVAYTA